MQISIHQHVEKHRGSVGETEEGRGSVVERKKRGGREDGNDRDREGREGKE